MKTPAASPSLPFVPRALAPDPGLANLRVATRAAAVYPLVLGFGLVVLRNPQMTLFAAFGFFSLTVLANFGGRALDRATASLVTAVVGAAMVALGTLASADYRTAALTTLVVAFAIEFSGVFGGYVAGARTPLLLALVLAASVPAPGAGISDRLIGWFIGGGAATAASLLLWPHFERDTLRAAAAEALRALARLIAAIRGDATPKDPRDTASTAVRELRRVYSETAYRPGGPTRRDRALTQLVTELGRAEYFADAAAAEPKTGNAGLPEGDRLAAAVVAAFDASAGVLQGGPAPDLRSLEEARVAHRRALDVWAGAQLRSGAGTDAVLDGLDSDHRLRMLSYLALAIGANATIAAGRRFDWQGVRIPYATPIRGGAGAALRRIGRTLRTHLAWTSPLLHDSIRAAFGLALAVLVARVLGLDRAFWVVLGTLSVLRSSALATGRTAVQALAGTVLGFMVGGLFTLWFAHDAAVLWVALPVAVFLAAYAPSAVSFVAGQASFTVLMLVLFNLLTPTGWRVGLVRIEDLVIGSVIGVAAGTLLWPSGVRADFAHALSNLYRLVAIHLSEAIDLALGRDSGAAFNVTRGQALQARERTAESFDQLLREHSSQLPSEVAGFMVAAADHALLLAESLHVAVDMGYVADQGLEDVRRMGGQKAALVASWFMLAERIEGVRAVGTIPLRRDELRQIALDCLAAWDGEPPERGRVAIAVAWTREWIEQLDTLVHDLEEPAAQVAASASAPWWR